jgi:hypothetical protein
MAAVFPRYTSRQNEKSFQTTDLMITQNYIIYTTLSIIWI